MQYAKRMDGNKSYTICGDPLYFAPEITSNLGYDFSADLWAYGVLVYEIYEGYTVFDAEATHEVKLFKTISEFK
jgi:serine/threonine protein kinase